MSTPRQSIELLKLTIRKAVANALDNFKRDTGLTPSAVEIRMIDVTPIGGPPEFTVGDVHIHIEG